MPTDTEIMDTKVMDDAKPKRTRREATAEDAGKPDLMKAEHKHATDKRTKAKAWEPPKEQGVGATHPRHNKGPAARPVRG